MRKELARINLPLAMYTEMYAVVDLHNLFHFLKLRLDRHAQYEIRVYAEALLKLIEPVVPVATKAFQDYVLGSMTFSAEELYALNRIVQDLIQGMPEYDIVKKHMLSNKREQKEFLTKLNSIGIFDGT
jgi:thymidylate synthase ThyX